MAKVKRRTILHLWKDVLFALLLRHLVSKFNDKFGVSWLIIQPVSFIVALSLLRGQMSGGEIHGLPAFMFMMLGFLGVLQFLQGWSSVSISIQKDKPLYAFRQVQPIASAVTAMLVELTAYILVLSVLVFIAILFGLDFSVDDPLMVLTYTIEIQLIGYFLGLIFAVGRLYVREVMKVESLLQRPLLFVSGAFFSLNDMPKETWNYVIWNPVLHGVELSRHAAKNQFPLVNQVSELYFHGFTIFIIFMGLAVYTAFWKKGIAR